MNVSPERAAADCRVRDTRVGAGMTLALEGLPHSVAKVAAGGSARYTYWRAYHAHLTQAVVETNGAGSQDCGSPEMTPRNLDDEEKDDEKTE